jgi:hypothetical protein
MCHKVQATIRWFIPGSTASILKMIMRQPWYYSVPMTIAGLMRAWIARTAFGKASNISRRIIVSIELASGNCPV